MASKGGEKTGLGSPEITGAEGLFDVSEPAAAASDPSTSKKVKQSNSKVSEETQEEDRVKTSLSLDEETIDLLNLLKPKARKKEGRFVSFGKIIDRAVKDLAIKMDVKSD